MYLNINSDSVVAFTNKLEKLHRSALPVSVRAGLNAAAFDVKKRTMPKTAKQFTQRSPTFFKSQSKVAPAKGFDIKTMQSEVGFIPSTGAKESGGATKDLEQQENSGQIGHRAFIPLKEARAGGSWNRNVKANLRFANLKNLPIINAQGVRFKGHQKKKKQKFVRAAIMAKKLNDSNAFVLGNRYRGQQTLSKINSISFNKEKGTIKISRTPIYTYKPNRKIAVAGKNFMKRASLESGIRIEKYYVDEALRQIKKISK
jgi:hypothetical protein